MGLRELVISATLALGVTGCKQQEIIEQARFKQEDFIEAPRIDQTTYYQRGTYFKELALKQTDEKRSLEFLALAVLDFTDSYRNAEKPYESLLERADCLSLGYNHVEALRTIEKALTLAKTADVYNLEGTIYMRMQAFGAAADAFTNAIKLKDTPENRWNRYEARLGTGLTQEIDYTLLNLAIEDAQVYLDANKELPDGYAAIGAVQAVIALASNDKDLLTKANGNLAEALRKLEKTPFKHKQLDPDKLRESYENTRQRDKEY